jgi:uncharacterized protein
MELIGRNREKTIFKYSLEHSESKLIALYGRRRVGKTFLVRQYFKSQIRFEVAGLHNGEFKDQLAHFASTLVKHGWQEAGLFPPKTWQQAFDLLERFINSMKDRQKKVIFLDELPWFDTPRSKFLMAFENFWNAYCTKRNDIVCVICGSAASWMIKKVLKNKGGLHNRVAEKIRLSQFSLYETQLFLQAKGIHWGKYDIVQLYMTTGGIPFYLDAIRKGESVVQFVDRACFEKDGILVDEYKVLFESLFDDSQRHYEVVEALERKKQGLTRNEIITKIPSSSGGSLTQVLDELEESGFLEQLSPYGTQTNKSRYKLVDNFVIFYLNFMKNKLRSGPAKWSTLVKTPTWASWSGLAFERICFAHLTQIKRALKLEAIECVAALWLYKDEEVGTQIDLLLDRADRVINICEIKFSSADFTIDKEYAKKMRNQINLFSMLDTNKRKNIFLTMITTFGVAPNEYQKELMKNEVVMDDLFTP